MTTGCIVKTNIELVVKLVWQPVWQPCWTNSHNRFDNRGCIHDTASCQTGCQTAL